MQPVRRQRTQSSASASSTVRRRQPSFFGVSSETSSDDHLPRSNSAVSFPSEVRDEAEELSEELSVALAKGAEELDEQRSLLMESRAALLDIDADTSGDEDDVMRPVPLLQRKVYVDDHDTLYILVFPRASDEHGGAVDAKRWRNNPRKCWERIFGRKHDEAPMHDRLEEGEFQELVRNQILKILRRLQVKAVATESVDKDEVFLKISARPAEVERLAETFHYAMPYKWESYKRVEGFGAYTGHAPMKNEMGDYVMAYEEYEKNRNSADLEEFRHVDALRLLAMQLSNEMHLNELVRQNILTRHFAAASFKQVHELNRDWGALLPNLCHPPGPKELELIRDYFGEEIAFFFWWFFMYIKFLLGLAAAGCSVQILLMLKWIPGHELNSKNRDVFCCLFGVAVVVWQIAFMKTTKSNMARLNQKWGMDGIQSLEFTLDSYDPKLEGTTKTYVALLATTLAVPMYMLFYAYIVTSLDHFASNHGIWGYSFFLTFLIKVMSFTWRRVAFTLAEMQNHRTQRRLNDALIATLSIVKIFCAVFPFIRKAFLMPLEQVVCKETLSDVANYVYSQEGWPEGVDAEKMLGYNGTRIPDIELSFLSMGVTLDGNQTCLSSCYPVKCHRMGDDDTQEPWVCQTNCMVSLSKSLIVFYLTHFALTCIYILIPVTCTTRSVNEELMKARIQSQKVAGYSFIQFQAKCHQNAAYYFSSWGGSYVEDFLEVLVGYTVLVCFGLWNPIMTLVGCSALILEYRLLAFRMTNVTCRPFPRVSQGIGAWEEVFEPIGMLGVTCNVLVMVLLLEPIRSMDWPKKLLCFVLFEKAIVVGRIVVVYVWPDTPSDVIRIDDFNADFKRRNNQTLTVLGTRKRADYSHVDVGLGVDLDDDGVAVPKERTSETEDDSEGAAADCI